MTGTAQEPSTGALLPDLQTVVPLHLQIQNSHQRETLRFSNGIANTGEGSLQFRPETVLSDESQVTVAYQELLDAQGAIVETRVASVYEFHPAHNHWHIGNVALFEVRPALDDGTGGAWGDPYVNDRGEAQSIKTTFCLIDWYALEGNSRTKDRIYFDCETGLQGIQPGWVDQYHQALEGQEVDVTGAPVGTYYLVSVADPDNEFLESDDTNNAAWLSFSLTRDSKGNPAIVELAHSACGSPGLCGVGAPNR